MHVLLIGIDAYPPESRFDALDGCVNDIDAVQRLLVDRLGVTPEEITRLASPRGNTVHADDVPSAPATRANIVSALRKLGSESVGPDDRVFIYYAGHGFSLSVVNGKNVACREGLVPVDGRNEPGAPKNFLHDLQINSLLRGITERTEQVTLILDSCNSGGATRGGLMSGHTVRGVTITTPVLAADLEGGDLTGTRGIGARASADVSACQVVAACLADENAAECVDRETGKKHGLLTQKLVSLLRAVKTQEDLEKLTWGRIWGSLVAAMGSSTKQHASLIGSTARRVFSGPRAEGDTGYSVTFKDGKYTLGAGTLVGITRGAKVAVYGSTPAHFPPLGSPEDSDPRVRVGTLKVISAEEASAIAVADPEGAISFELPDGARARLVERSEQTKLAVGLSPHDEGLATQIKASKLLRLVEPGEHPAVQLESCGNGDWALTDSVFGKEETPETPMLFTIPKGSLSHARAVLEHYVRYSEPFRMADLCTTGALEMTLLDCSDVDRLYKENPTAPDLPEILPALNGLLERTARQEIVLRVKNVSGTSLHVWLFVCTSEGTVDYLGKEMIAPSESHVFWSAEGVGKPFVLGVPEGRKMGVERYVAIGTTDVGSSLDHLTMAGDPEDSEKNSFAGVLAPASHRGTTGGTREADPPAELQWTAARLMLRVKEKST